MLTSGHTAFVPKEIRSQATLLLDFPTVKDLLAGTARTCLDMNSKTGPL